MTELCWLCLGSNHEAASAMPQARCLLKKTFPDIRFGREQVTEPINFPFPSLFTNQTACFLSSRSIEEIHARLKEIERLCGRTDTEKAKGVVRMDIDLLQYGRHILKPQDMEHPHIIKGMQELRLPDGAEAAMPATDDPEKR